MNCDAMSYLSITDCQFFDNNATGNGGCINIIGISPTLENCSFYRNHSGGNGGAIACNNNASPIFNTCIFIDNDVTSYGGGMYIASSSPQLTDCTFKNNYTTIGHGGGMFCLSSSPQLTDCSFESNVTDGSGGGIFCSNNSSPAIDTCTFKKNTADDDGGGLYCSSSSPQLTECWFDSNSTTFSDGAGIVFSGVTSTTVQSCVFTGNTAYSDGGGIVCKDNASPTITLCTFSGNSASNNDGGGMYCYLSSPTIEDCIFLSNTALNGAGGGVHFYICPGPLLNRCTLYGNHAMIAGGGIACNGTSEPVISGCILDRNRVDDFGAGLYIGNDSQPRISRCTFYGNTCEGTHIDRAAISIVGTTPSITIDYTIVSFTVNGQAINCPGDRIVHISCCDLYSNENGDWEDCVQGKNGVDGNISANPRFCYAPFGNFNIIYLSPCAPCCHPAGEDCGYIGIGISACHKPTRVELASFTAEGSESGVRIHWTTASELGTAGFNIHRSRSTDAGTRCITGDLILTQGDEFNGATYSFTDDDATAGVTYYYWLEDVGLDGESAMHGPVSAIPGRGAGRPPAFNLAQNNPNPFGLTTEIKYDLPADCDVRLTIYDAAGRRVRTLVAGRQAAGGKTVQWDGRNEKGARVSGGIYFYRLEVAGRIQMKKMVFLR
ncbi:MAG: right-handed parallel beta-helix repeat-containing protein [bacterium]|nr:MAG: right-handed parallel beta-helix repeat-containing protein [bacterium]